MQAPDTPHGGRIWDPHHPEWVREEVSSELDLFDLLQIPPMRCPDDTYFVFGGWELCGTNYFDKNGLPIADKKPSGSAQTLLIIAMQSDWIADYRDGRLKPRAEMDLPVFQYVRGPSVRRSEESPG